MTSPFHHVRRRAHVAGCDLRIAVQFLTRLPIRLDHWPQGAALSHAVPWFPLVGAGIGLAVAAGYLGAAWLGLPAAVCALMALGLGAALSGALHEDGLADCADGLAGGANRARKLAIMRDSRIGTFGVLALLLSVGLRTACLAQMESVLPACVVAHSVSRALMLAPMRLSPARDDGLAHAAGRLAAARFAAALALAVTLSAVIAPYAVTLVAIAAAALLTLAWVALCRWQLGGHTGDTLGANEQIVQTVVLMSFSAGAAW